MNKRKGRSPKHSLESERAEASLIRWLEKLARHHKITLDQAEIDIYLDGLRGKTEYQINVACMRCLTEILFMPKLPEILKCMPDQAHSEYTRIYTERKPILDITREIAREICPALIGLEYQVVYESDDDRLRSWVFFNANIVRYLRMHKDPAKWLGDNINYLGVPVNMNKLREYAAWREQSFVELTGLDPQADPTYDKRKDPDVGTQK